MIERGGVDDGGSAAPLRGMAHPEVRRFSKYAIVGAGSFVFGFAVFNLLYLLTHWLILSTTLSYILSAINGFIWNRRWTFKEKRGQNVWVQCSRFLAVNAVGYVLNTAVMVALLAVYTHATNPHLGVGVGAIARSVIVRHGGPRYSLLVVNGAGVVATAVVTVWNFLANRAWSFRH